MVTDINTPGRKQLINQVLSATSLTEVNAAMNALDRWMEQHPDDIGIVDGYEMLENMQEIAEAQEAERTGGVLMGKAA